MKSPKIMRRSSILSSMTILLLMLINIVAVPVLASAEYHGYGDDQENKSSTTTSTTTDHRDDGYNNNNNYGKPPHHDDKPSPPPERDEDDDPDHRADWPYDPSLSFSFYHKSCPEFESTVYNKVAQWIKKDPTLAPSLLRLFFHDCVVRGCDASILLNHEGSERMANASKTLRGFELIDDIKQELEKKCPKTISCADILAAATREATVKAGGPFWSVPYGRKDGKVSIAEEAERVPMGRERITDLIQLFQSIGLNVLDLAVLSGAHTIGRCTCGSLQHRLYDFEGTGKPDPSINPKYLNYLRRKCRWASEYVELDAVTPDKFDLGYYKNIEKNMGLLSTDQMLSWDSRTSSLVTALASQPELFNTQFGVSMTRLGNIISFTADEDHTEVRLKCSSLNLAY